MVPRLIALLLVIITITNTARAAGIDSTAHTTIVDSTLPDGIFPNTWEIISGSGSTVSGVGLIGIADDTLLLTGPARATILVTEIELMRRRNGGHFWRGAAWGAGIMAPLGVAGLAFAGTEPASRRLGQMSLVLGMWAGAAVFGGIIGSFFPRTEEVELAPLPVDERRETLALIAAEDSIERAEAIARERARARRRAARSALKSGSK